MIVDEENKVHKNCYMPGNTMIVNEEKNYCYAWNSCKPMNDSGWRVHRLHSHIISAFFANTSGTNSIRSLISFSIFLSYSSTLPYNSFTFLSSHPFLSFSHGNSLIPLWTVAHKFTTCCSRPTLTLPPWSKHSLVLSTSLSCPNLALFSPSSHPCKSFTWLSIPALSLLSLAKHSCTSFTWVPSLHGDLFLSLYHSFPSLLAPVSQDLVLLVASVNFPSTPLHQKTFPPPPCNTTRSTYLCMRTIHNARIHVSVHASNSTKCACTA